MDRVTAICRTSGIHVQTFAFKRKRRKKNVAFNVWPILGACLAVWSQWSQRVNGVNVSMGYEVAHGTHAALPPGQDYGPDTTTYSYTSIVK
jgi:hypothetical protein